MPSGKSFEWASRLGAFAGLALLATQAAQAGDVLDMENVNALDPRPIYEQRPAVDGINFQASLLSGAIGGYANHMFMVSASTPFPYFDQFGAQLDLGIGNYRTDYISAASGLHLFWRDPAVGLVGIYGDWGYVNPEHAGKVGVEASIYNGAWTLDVLAGVQFGQHVYTKFVDEVDLTYYFAENFKASIGHRLMSRGHVANVGFEYMPEGYNGWSLFGEAEAGEDDYYGAWAGLRYSFGMGKSQTLMQRDREAGMRVRLPRNIASVTQCGDLPEEKPKDWWRGAMHQLCASKQELEDEGAVIVKY